MRIALIAALALALAAIAPAAAPAQEGVHVDPGSPAGKEYALPLEQARREAAGRKGSAPGSTQPKTGRSALFGQGIEKGSPATAKSAGRSGRKRRAAKPGDAARLAAPATSAGRSAALTDISIVLAVLLAAGAAGLLLRRVLR